MKGIDIDKCTESYTVKIPEILKHNLDLLPSPNRAALKESILLTIARHIHENNFDPAQYLTSREN
ncbi:MAG: hypothetical protein JEZ12_16115 [Desulfobacterium sp.]|nr:hypothetical protein [Desulfobacterium sp.]